MCLESLSPRLLAQLKDTKTAYKVMIEYEPGEYRGEYYTAAPEVKDNKKRELGNKKFYRENIWYDDPQREPIFMDYENYYPTGFHAYVKRPSWLPVDVDVLLDSPYVVVKVSVENIVAAGKDSGHVTIVARRMMILGKVDRYGKLIPKEE